MLKSLKNKRSYMVVCDSSDKEKCLEERSNSVGASDRITNGTWEKKTGRKDSVFSYQTRKFMWFGNHLEKSIIKGWSAWSGVPCRYSGTMLKSKRYPFISATLDGIAKAPKDTTKLQRYLTYDQGWNEETGGGMLRAALNAKGIGCLEVKNVGKSDRNEKYWFNGSPNPEYYKQVQHQMLVTGMSWSWLIAMVGGQNYRCFFIQRNQAYIDKLVEKIKDLWFCVDQDIPYQPGK
jgi:predicted phage-related endonuclease